MNWSSHLTGKLNPFAEPRIRVGRSRFGFGVFSRRKFVRGELILAFSGSVIHETELLSLGEYTHYALQIDKDLFLDLDGPGRFVNHSCAPNAGMASDNLLVAINNIERDTEIFYDYSTTMLNDEWRMVCHCGSKRCRGIVQSFERLPREVQMHYIATGLLQRFIHPIVYLPSPKYDPAESRPVDQSISPHAFAHHAL